MQDKNSIKIAIHHQKGNDSYSDKWIEYCQKNQIEYKLVNCYDSNIVEQLSDCSGLMWHWQHTDYRAKLFAKELILSLNTSNFHVYPNAKTCWHFDDKLAQKYLLESIKAPLVKSYAFFEKERAIDWIESTEFPKVFKLRSGAGAYNVNLIKNKKEAKRYINRAFSSGFKSNYSSAILRERVWQFKRDKSLKSFFNIAKGVGRVFFPHKIANELPVERNYLYAQDFIAGCDHDIRVFVIGNRAVTKKRMVREGDFRASGSGKMSWDIGEKAKECVAQAFEIKEKLDAQSVAFDFVLDGDRYKIVEISYAASPRGFPDTPGYWDRELNWHECRLRAEYFMMEDFIESIES